MYKVSWSEYVDYSTALGVKIQSEGKKYQGMLVIARGGTVVGTILSHLLALPMALIIGESYDKEHVQKSIKLSEIIKPKSLEIKGNWLIVDDLVDTGNTIEAIKKLSIFSNTSLDVAALFHKGLCKEPDFWIELKSDWIRFPYEKE